ncbi:MAG: LruC domain-containing protein [Bacteroidetes bacterium]|nr:LruC domain-containing protein [Bacteroidota bacterium]
MKSRLSLLILALFIGFAACKKDEETQSSNTKIEEDIRNLQIPSAFNFETAQEVQTDVEVKGLQGQALGGVKVSFYTDHPDFGGQKIGNGLTNSNGRLVMPLQVPAFQEQVFIRVHQSGFANIDSVPVQAQINKSFGGILPQRKMKTAGIAATPVPISGNYFYMGAYNIGNYKGLPQYLESNGDNLSQQFLDDVDASLPEEAPVPTNNPQYLTSGNELDVVITDLSDVWVTFVAEGAGYRNSLAYYVFDSNNPPATANDIDSIFIIFPNTSLAYSGGELYAGDKVRLGTFEAGKTISWVLFQNAWNGSGVNVNNNKFYSNPAFNTNESNPNRQHTVALSDIGRQLVLIGFEDQTRTTGSDNDFNDLIFYVSANPWESIDVGSLPPVTPTQDSDGDGVADESDDFPNDASRAVLNNYQGSLAFEDLWPAQGDYDFNDLVLDYDIDHILNASNEVINIDADWTIKAVGASFDNGFGFSFDNLQPSEISSISGSDLQENYISLSANGAEAAQSMATAIVFDNVYNLISTNGGAYINTEAGQSPVNPETISMSIVFNNPTDQGDVGIPPYNSFLIVNGIRGREIHLAGHQPTDLADQNLFNSLSDATILGSNYLYKTDNGLPWAIHFSNNFSYPLEQQPIDDAYLYFSQWAVSGGSTKADWFEDVSGYRDVSKIY